MNEAFAHPVTRGIVAATVGVVALAAALIFGLGRAGRVAPALQRELWLRLGSWVVLLPFMLGPVLIGRVWLIGAVTVLALVCLREYDRATGLFREPVLAGTVALGILLVNFAALDHWYGFFVALFPLVVVALAAVSIPLDRGPRATSSAPASRCSPSPCSAPASATWRSWATSPAIARSCCCC